MNTSTLSSTSAPTPATLERFDRLFKQLERNQWLAPETIKRNQFKQIQALIKHAIKTVPFYRSHLPNTLTSLSPEGLSAIWPSVPLLSRRAIQGAGDAMQSLVLSTRHLPINPKTTSGSTGQPVKLTTTARTQLLWTLLTLRDHHWHQRDFSGKFATIRYSNGKNENTPQGAAYADWGLAKCLNIKTGSAHQLSINQPIRQQIQWLRQINPRYLLTYPHNLIALVKQWPRHLPVPPGLRECRTFGETLTPAQRQWLHETTGLAITDCYSSQEVGYIALQCPESGSYHCQSENVLVEVLTDNNQPAQPGETGRVVVTNLHNYATPIIRYDIGDYAQVADHCRCGRGLTSLRRIIGRSRNMMRLPNGDSVWPSFAGDGSGKLPDNFPIISQYQIRQTAIDALCLHIVCPAPLTNCEKSIVIDYIHKTLAYPFTVTFNFVKHIPRSPSGKFEDFICEID